MSRWQYTKGLHDIGDGVVAHPRPNGSLGLSNMASRFLEALDIRSGDPR